MLRHIAGRFFLNEASTYSGCVALDAALSEKQNAEIEAALAKEKAEVSKSEVKRIELMVSV